MKNGEFETLDLSFTNLQEVLGVRLLHHVPPLLSSLSPNLLNTILDDELLIDGKILHRQKSNEKRENEREKEEQSMSKYLIHVLNPLISGRTEARPTVEEEGDRVFDVQLLAKEGFQLRNKKRAKRRGLRSSTGH